MPGMQRAHGEHVADVGVPHHAARWLAEEAEPGGKGRSKWIGAFQRRQLWAATFARSQEH